MPPDSRPLPDVPAISDDGWSRAYRARRSAATTGPCRCRARHRRQTSATCADRPHRRWSAHRACPGAGWAGGYRRRAAGPPPARALPRPRGWPDPDAAAEDRSAQCGERGDDAARPVRRLHRRRIRLLRLRHHGILRCGRRLREARLRRRRHRTLRLRGLRLHDLLRGLGLRSLPLLRRLSHLRRSTLRGPRLRPAGNGRRRRNLRPWLADSRAPRCSRAHATGGLHAGRGRRRGCRRRHALPHRRLAGRSLSDRRRLPGRRFSLSLGPLCFREGRTCRLASRGQVGHGLGRRHLGAARGSRCSA